jgi:hypothetical protein
MRAGWHPYEGLKVRGAPVLTMLRGRTIVKDNQFCGEEGAGCYQMRCFDPALRQRAAL